MAGIRCGTCLCGALALLLVVSSGCARNEAPRTAEQPAPPISEDDTSPLDRSRDVSVRVHATITGAADVQWQGTEIMTIARVGKLGTPVNLFSAGFTEPVRLPDEPTLRFRWAVELLDAYDDKPGDHVIQPTVPGAAGVSSAFVVVLRVNDAARDKLVVHDWGEVESLRYYDHVRQPCTLHIGDDESEGRLHCPELATAEGETVAATIEWSA